MATATAELLSRALEPAGERASDPTSERILDAALALSAASGVRNLTMDDVADRARVGRMTVYRRFGGREQLLEALAVREARRCLAEIDRAIDPSRPAEDQIAEGFVTALRLSRDHPLLNRLARVEPESVLASLTADGGVVLSLMRAYLAQRIREAQERGEVPQSDPDAAAELLIRLCISFVLIQDSVIPLDDEEEARSFARRMIAPALTAPVR